MNVAGASQDPMVLHFHVDLQKSSTPDIYLQNAGLTL